MRPAGAAAALCAALVLLGTLAGRVAAQPADDPDARVPPDATFEILDLQFRVEPIAGSVRALEITETATEVRVEVPADVLFDFDKADIRPDATQALAEVATLLRRHARRGAVIEGHTDGKGSEEYNRRLSERRAEAVKRWLQEREGVKGVALRTVGLGASRPVAPNTKPDGGDDPEGRRKNRRVEIVIAKRAPR